MNDERPDHIAVFGADHVYRMDPAQMVDQHIDSGMGVTVAGIRVPRAEARAFGCIDSDATGKITQLTKTSDAETAPRFTQDGKRISFARGGNLYVMGLEGGPLVQLTDIRSAAAPTTTAGCSSHPVSRTGSRR